MRSNIPSFRLPEAVLYEEIDYILDMGVDIRYNTPVEEHESPVGRELRCDLRWIRRTHGARTWIFLDATSTNRIHIGIDWLESVAFGHIESIGERVLIIGVGNTAMDCCRTSRRLGRQRNQGDGSPATRLTSRHLLGSSRTPRKRGVEIIINHAPKRFVIEEDSLVGMEFERPRVGHGCEAINRHRYRDITGRRRDSGNRSRECVSVDRA